MKWKHLLIWACIVHITEACFDDGEFYCAKLWYFWFVVFFIFVFMLIGAIITTNLCKKKKRRVGPRGNAQRRTQRKSNACHRGSKASILSKATITTENTNSPQLSTKFAIPEKSPLPPSSKDGDKVANKKFLRQIKGDDSHDQNAPNVEKGAELPSIGNNTTVTKATRELPSSTVREEDEPDHASQNLGDDIEDTSC